MSKIKPIIYTSPFSKFAKESTDWNEEDKEKKEHVDRLKKYLKSQLIRKFNSTCFFCKHNVSQANSYSEIEHILTKSNPKYVNFTFNPNNLVLSCKVCNNLKSVDNVLCDEKSAVDKVYLYDEYPLDSLDFKIVHPYLDDYDDHIKIEGIFYLVVNDSEKGRNTIKFYHLSRLSLAESKIKKDNEFKNEKIRNIMNENYPQSEVSVDSNVVINLIDKKLNPNDVSQTNLNRIDKIRRINQENFEDFKKFRMFVDGLDKLKPNWFENDIKWYTKNEYIDKVKNSICFLNKQGCEQKVLDNIMIVLDGLNAFCGTDDLRKSIENIEICDIYYIVNEFRSFLNDTGYSNNEQLIMINPVHLAIQSRDCYKYKDFTEDIKSLIKKDKSIVTKMKSIFKLKKHTA